MALANKVKNMAGDLVKFQTTPKHSSASNPAERAIQAVEEQSRTIRADCQMRFGSSENLWRGQTDLGMAVASCRMANTNRRATE